MNVSGDSVGGSASRLTVGGCGEVSPEGSATDGCGKGSEPACPGASDSKMAGQLVSVVVPDVAGDSRGRLICSAAALKWVSRRVVTADRAYGAADSGGDGGAAAGGHGRLDCGSVDLAG
jgi:hypothetical protein